MPKRSGSKSIRRTIHPDLVATLEQAVVDKLVASVTYPLMLFDEHWPFQGKLGADDVLYTQTQASKLLQRVVSSSNQGLSAPTSDQEEFDSSVLSGVAPVIESAKSYLRAREEAANKGDKISGPNPQDVQDILDGGIVRLATYRGIQFKAHLAWLHVEARSAPTVGLASPTIKVDDVKVSVGATAELWWYHPTLHCRKWCLDWSTSWSWDRLAAITVSGVRLAADAHAVVAAGGAVVEVRAVVDKLRLDYDLLRDIPLESFANSVLAGKPLYAYDASKLIATVPVLESRFAVQAIDVPTATGSLSVNVEIRPL